MAAKKKKAAEAYEHKGEKRVNNPPVGLVTPETEPVREEKKQYAYDPHLDPQLQWAGKAEHTSFEVPTVSLHVHERIDPKSILKQVQKEEDDEDGGQMSLFEQEKLPLREALDFYKHQHGWSNRLIAGDSLLVMNSLLEKEGMGGKVQMLYFDPPYGIKYGSNFQPFTNKRDVKDSKDEDLTAEPEMLKAFRDTWELGIHSYLTYLRDRLLLARELLHESGSVFVQISDENVHHVREIMDEVFGKENFAGQIVFAKTSAFTSTKLSSTYDYTLWYFKNNKNPKFRALWLPKQERTKDGTYNYIELPNGSYRALTANEKKGEVTMPEGKRFRADNIVSTGATKTGSNPIKFNGKDYLPSPNSHWKTTENGMYNLIEKKRVLSLGQVLAYKRYTTDFPLMPLPNVWNDTILGTFSNKLYVVQTPELPITRCLLMTTDPGDLVMDITCGSGTTAAVAEQWGRRWITCDTSRVATTLAKQRLMTKHYDYYKLKHPQEGVGSGFEYKTVPHITLKSIANNEPPGEETLYDQPLKEGGRRRVTGPFTVEAVPAPQVRGVDSGQLPVASGQNTVASTADTSIARSGETLRQEEWREELLRTGVRGKGGRMLEFSRIEPLPGTRWIQAEGETREQGEESSKKVLVVFGPEHAPLEQRTVENAWQEARALRPDILLFCAFQFDEEAAKDIDELTPEKAGMQLLKAQMNADLLTDDLRKKRSSNESFWLIGQPDVAVESLEFLVFSNQYLATYEILKELSGLDCVEEIHGLGEQDLQLYLLLSQGREVWHYLADAEGWQLYSGEHCGGAGKAKRKGVPAISFDSAGVASRVRDFYQHFGEFGISGRGELRRIAERLRGSGQVAGRLKEISQAIGVPWVTKHSKLATENWHCVAVLGFDYYNPKTGDVESGGKGDIAMWMLDTDYDDRAIFPSQVFFPMAGAKEGWAKLAKNLKAEIDDEKMEAFRGTVSLPFKKGENAKVAVKIIDARGIESLRVMGL